MEIDAQMSGTITSKRVGFCDCVASRSRLGDLSYDTTEIANHLKGIERETGREGKLFFSTFKQKKKKILKKHDFFFFSPTFFFSKKNS